MTSPSSIEKLAYTVQEFKKASGLSHTTVYKLINSGQLQSKKILGRRMINGQSARAMFAVAA